LKYFEYLFLTHPGCHLCDEARPLVISAVNRAGGSLREVDIDADDTLTRDYGLRIPVVLGPSGEVLAEGKVDRSSLRKAIRVSRREKGV
jgi:hypothetical protein